MIFEYSGNITMLNEMTKELKFIVVAKSRGGGVGVKEETTGTTGASFVLDDLFILRKILPKARGFRRVFKLVPDIFK